MTYIVTERCVKCRYTDCMEECPVQCFYEITDPAMLVINPDTCIDCDMCVPLCPINAIWADHELPEEYTEWLQQNADRWEGAENITERKEALEGAKTLDVIQAAEKEKGWDIVEPESAAH